MAKNDDTIIQLLNERLEPGEELVEYLTVTREPFHRVVLMLLFFGTGILPGVIIYYSMLKHYLVGMTQTGLVMLRTNSKYNQVLAEKIVPFASMSLKTSKMGMRRIVTVRPKGESAVAFELSPSHKKVTDGVKRRDRLFDALTKQAKAA